MAPTRPSSSRAANRAKALARLADPTLPRKVHRPEAVVDDSFINSKRDRRQIRHASFVSRIASSSSASITKSKKRVRRPSKKLVTTLSALADALPDIPPSSTSPREDGDGGSDDGAAGGGGNGKTKKIRHKSLHSRPGALKRRERVVRAEMARFGASLAQLNVVAATREGQVVVGAPSPAEGSWGKGGGSDGMDMDGSTAARSQPRQGHTTAGTAAGAAAGKTRTSTSSRWATLRTFISATMEQNPAFAVQGQGQSQG